MITYVNNGGAHVLADGSVIESGKTFQSNDADLCKKFPNKFQAVAQAAAPVPAPVPEGGGGDADVDVTNEFPDAAANGLTVIKDKKGWHVLDEDGDAINDAPLKKRDVAGVVQDYIE